MFVSQRPSEPPAGGDAASAPASVVATHDVTPSADGLRAARTFVRETLQSWAVETRVANAALDVAHELVSNAVRHGDPPVELILALHGSAVEITVSDASPLPARRLPYRSGVSERGLGLRLVAQLSREWGQQPDADGKSVWAKVGMGARQSVH